MTIQFNTDHNIEGNERLEAFLDEKVTTALNRFSEQITRVEIHLSDDNAGKADLKTIKCLLEARLEGLDPIVVTEHETTIEKSVNGAIDKLKAVLTTTLGRLANH